MRSSAPDGVKPRAALSQQVAGVAYFPVAYLVSQSAPIWATAVTVSSLVLGIFLLRNARELLAILLGAVPYGVGAYFGAINGIRFYPFPPIEGYWDASRDQLVALLVCAGIGISFGVARLFHESVRRAIRKLQTTHLSSMSLRIIQLGAIGVFLWDGFHVGTNYSLITSSGRHVINDSLVIGAGTMGIVLLLTISCALAIDAFVSRIRPRTSLLLLALMWMPSVLAGKVGGKRS